MNNDLNMENEIKKIENFIHFLKGEDNFLDTLNSLRLTTSTKEEVVLNFNQKVSESKKILEDSYLKLTQMLCLSINNGTDVQIDNVNYTEWKYRYKYRKHEHKEIQLYINEKDSKFEILNTCLKNLGYTLSNVDHGSEYMCVNENRNFFNNDKFIIDGDETIYYIGYESLKKRFVYWDDSINPYNDTDVDNFSRLYGSDLTLLKEDEIFSIFI